MSLETVELVHELGWNFINYAMAVNSDRSIPDSTTGLKPVHKRILYCALMDGNTSNKKYVKCANNVGSMLANWHPHGDASVYAALVRLSQPWVMRYPLIDFHGNMGNESGDPPAHYRYTECRLEKISEDGILNGVEKHAVEFEPNFDETKQEPKNLPAVFPNLLCNPNSGIGVSLACSWAPHNLREVANAIMDYLDDKEPTLPGPDFPTGGIIINKNDIPNIMETGKGSVKIRAKYKIKDNSIVFYELPYGVITEDIIKELQDLAFEDKLEGAAEIRDESDKVSTKIVIDCKKNANLNKIINIAFQSSSLQSSFSYNQVALVNKEPRLLTLKQCIKIYVEHNVQCIVNEHKFELDKAVNRMEVVSGLLKALEDIDNIIALIKSTKTAKEAKEKLQERYGFSKSQAQAIVDMKLGKLASLEKVEIENELAELEDKIKSLTNFISCRDMQIDTLKERLNTIVKKYGDDRRTELTQVKIEKKAKEQVIIEPKECVVVITNNGNIKRVDSKSFKVSKRNTVGIKANGNLTIFSQKTNTQDVLMVFTSKGKMYRLLVDNIPEGTNASTGTYITSLVSFEENEIPLTYTTLSRDTTKKFLFFATKNGIVKKVPLSEYDNVKRTGTLTIKLKEGDELVVANFIDDEDIILLTKCGMAIKFQTTELPISSRIAQGVKGIKLNDGDSVIDAVPVAENDKYLVIVSKKGLGKKIELSEFLTQARGGKGLICSKEQIAGGMSLNEDRNILINGDISSIVIDTKELPIIGRTSAGNITLKNNREILSISLL